MNAPCSHPARHELSHAALHREMARGEARAVEGGQRWTAPRRRVFELLLQANGPVKAYDLMADFSDGAAAKPPTVYRALEFLESLGLAHRIASLNAYVACDADTDVHAASFMICDCCGSAEEFDPKIQAAAQAEAEHLGFRPVSLALEVRGRCRNCA